MKKDIKNLYGTFKTVNCPYLEEEVNFNSKGLNHLFYKKSVKQRLGKEIKTKNSSR